MELRASNNDVAFLEGYVTHFFTLLVQRNYELRLAVITVITLYQKPHENYRYQNEDFHLSKGDTTTYFRFLHLRLDIIY